MSTLDIVCCMPQEIWLYLNISGFIFMLVWNVIFVFQMVSALMIYDNPVPGRMHTCEFRKMAISYFVSNSYIDKQYWR